MSSTISTVRHWWSSINMSYAYIIFTSCQKYVICHVHAVLPYVIVGWTDDLIAGHIFWCKTHLGTGTMVCGLGWNRT